MNEMMSRETKAQNNFFQIQRAVCAIESNFIVLARLLWECQHEGYWSDIKRESFQELAEEVGLEYSFATRLVNVYQVFKLDRGLEDTDLLAMGVSRAVVLLPEARKGTLTEEMIEQAKLLSVRDLRLERGLKVTEADKSYSINCPRCNCEIAGARWVSKPKIATSQEEAK